MHVDSDRFWGGGVGTALSGRGMQAVHLPAAPYVPHFKFAAIYWLDRIKVCPSPAHE